MLDEHIEDVERDHLRDPEVEWLEPLVGVWQRLRNGCHTLLGALPGVVFTPRPATCNKPRHVRSDSPVVCQLFYVI